MRLEIKTGAFNVLKREVNAWKQILNAKNISLREKLFQGWRQVISYAYNLYWRMGNPCEQWIRIIMNEETKKLISEIYPESLKVLEISGTQWQNYQFASYKTIGYPEFDICQSILDDTYDLIIAEQVFEHLLWPYRAGCNVYKMLKPGGYFLITTPFLVRVHYCPVDCTRWTETGLKYFLAECGFPLELTKTGSWGNRQFLKQHAKHGICEYYVKYFHSLKNEELYPATVWALAQKAY